MPPISVTISKVDPETHKIIQSITREVPDAESIGFNFFGRRISASSYGHIPGGSVEIDFVRFTTDRNERLSVGLIKLRDEYFLVTINNQVETGVEGVSFGKEAK